MIKNPFKNCRGALLFEVFVALIVLSVGLAGMLRLFSQTLFTSERNLDQSRAKRHLQNLLFSEWAGLPEEPGSAADALYTYKVDLEPLVPASAQMREAGANAQNRYYHMKINVFGRREQKVFSTETIIFGSKRPAS